MHVRWSYRQLCFRCRTCRWESSSEVTPYSSSVRAQPNRQKKASQCPPNHRHRCELLRRRGCSFADFRGGAESFVVGVANRGDEMDGASAEPQGVVGAGIGRKPKVAEKIFAIGSEARKEILLFLFDDIGDRFAVRFDNLQVLVVHPEAALEVALIFLDDFWSGVKDVGGEFVHFLAADVSDVVFMEFIAGERKGLNTF